MEFDYAPLSSRDLAGLQGVLSVLAQPASFSGPSAWMQETVTRLRALLGADKVLCFLAGPGGGPDAFAGIGDGVEEALRSWAETYAPLDFELERVRAARGGSVYHRDLVWRDPSVFNRTVLYQEWMAPNGLCDILGCALDPPGGPPLGLLHAYHTTERRLDDPDTRNAFGIRGLTLMRLLTPAFQSATRFEHASAGLQRELGCLLDGLPIPAFLVRPSGSIMHANGPGEAALARSGPADGLRRRLARAAGDLCSAASGRADLETLPFPLPGAAGRRTPHVVGTRVTVGRESAALLMLPDSRGVTPTPESLQFHFGLTPRQALVACWIVQGESTQEIARRGQIRPATVRRHVEAIFARLSCHSRAELVARVLG